MVLAACWNSFWWCFMCRMIRLTPLAWEERFCIRIAIGEKQRGHANRKGLGLAMGLFVGRRPFRECLFFTLLVLERECYMAGG